MNGNREFFVGAQHRGMYLDVPYTIIQSEDFFESTDAYNCKPGVSIIQFNSNLILSPYRSAQRISTILNLKYKGFL